MRVGIARGDIAWAAIMKDAGNGVADNFFKGFHDLPNRVAHAGAEVDGHCALQMVEPLDGGDVTCGKIAHMQIVPHAGAVGVA